MKNLFGKNGLYDKLVFSIKGKDITMNKYLTGIIALCALPMSAFAAADAASELSTFDDRTPLSEKLLREYKTEKPNVVYRQKETPVNVVIKEYKMEAPKNVRVSKWYMGLRGDLSFLTWKNKYSGVDGGSERFTFKPVVGLDLAVGYRFDQKWRGEVELGYIGKFSDTETESISGFPVEKTDFSLQTYYLNVDAYYDIAYGLYAGLGAGLAIVDLDADHTAVANASATNVSPMGAAMFGWSYVLDEKVDFDIRYRLSIFDGGDLNIGGVNLDTGVIVNNTISAGVRYHF